MPPDNGGYMVAGYVVTSLILVGYTWNLWRRARRVTSYEFRVTSATDPNAQPTRNP